MTVTVDPLAAGMGRLTLDGKDHLGIRISSHSRNVAGQFADARRDPGTIVRGDRIEPWELEGFIEHERSIYVYGPYLEGSTLSQILELPASESLEVLYRLARAVSLLVSRSSPIPRPTLGGILALSDGGFLFAPEAALNGARTAQTEAERIESAELYAHPDLRGERSFVYFVGILAYRILTGSLPYTGKTEEELHERMRTQPPLDPRLLVPEIMAEAASSVMCALDARKPCELEVLARDLGEWTREGYTRSISDDERRERTAEAERVRQRLEGEYRRKSFLRRNWRTFAIVAAAVVVVGWIAGTIVKSELRPRITVGMSPAQVVHLFYTSASTFNNQAMQDCVVGSAGKNWINEAMTLYVMTRVRQGYEGSSGYISAATWKKEGEPVLKPGVSVYGLTDLSIKPIGNALFRVSYEKWISTPPPQAESSQSTAPVVMRVSGTSNVDEVALRNEGKYWAIYRIDHLSSTPVEPASSHPASR